MYNKFFTPPLQAVDGGDFYQLLANHTFFKFIEDNCLQEEKERAKSTKNSTKIERKIMKYFAKKTYKVFVRLTIWVLVMMCLRFSVDTLLPRITLEPGGGG